MKQKLINLFKDKGFLITLGFSFLILCIFFGKPLFHANSTYFGTSGDGMQIYYTSLYHVMHDDSYFFQKCMNYPYGENVFFTACQPFLTAPLKLLGLSGITIGVTNLIMLFSIVLSALFIYLILKELEVPYLYAAVCAVAIAYLSPQMVRLYAHYVLTYQFAVPAFIYALMRFYKAPSIKKSLLISLLTFFMATTHLYFFGFFALLSAFYWGSLFVLRKEQFKKIGFCIKHFSIQIIAPYVILQLIILTVNNVHDRTQNPWGILEYKTNWTGVFYPFQRYYEFIPQAFGIVPQEVNESEGLQFAGLLATLFFVFIIFKMVFNIVTLKFKSIFSLTGNLMLDIFLWCSIVALFYSFGYPFIFNHEDWLNSLGVLKQMRGIARFAWLFYYVANIAAVYICYLAVRNIKFSWLRYSFLFVVALIISLDAYPSLGAFKALNNKIPELNDKKNKAWQNQIFKTFDPEKYQAIMSMPYFHMGSENVGLEPDQRTVLYSYIFSLKTGLPLLCNTSSRTSLSQTFNSLAVALEKTSEPLAIIKEFKNRKPLLLIVNPDKIREEEKEVLALAKPVGYYTSGFQLYSLSVDDLESLPKKMYPKYSAEFNAKKLFKAGDSFSEDSVKRFVELNHDAIPTKIKFKGAGARYGLFKQYNDLFYDTIPNCFPGTEYKLSFWMYNYQKDLYPRLTIAIEVIDKEGKFREGYYTSTNRKLVCVIGKWALIETGATPRERTDKIKLTAFFPNMPYKKDTLIVDEILVRPMGINVFKKADNFIYKNNRYYYN